MEDYLGGARGELEEEVFACQGVLLRCPRCALWPARCWQGHTLLGDTSVAEALASKQLSSVPEALQIVYQRYRSTSEQESMVTRWRQ